MRKLSWRRFKNELLDVKYKGKNINDVLNMTVNEAVEFFSSNGNSNIVKRLLPLQEVGLGYIKLGQNSCGAYETRTRDLLRDRQAF
jgi:excinuclease ABC subunit A